MGFLVGVAATALAVAVIMLLAGKLIPAARSPGSRESRLEKKATQAPAASPRLCPLCSCELALGERVKSDILRGKSDSLMRIYGCPHCWPSVPGANERHCPVCGATISPEGHAVARYFERPGRKHVHVLGCTECRTMSPRRI